MPSLSDYQLVRLAKILRRNRLVQMPCNIHWLAAGVLHIDCRAKTGIRCSANAVLLELPHKENDLAAALPVVDITLTGACRIGGRALTLPMEQTFVDRIVVVHGSRGVVLVRFYCTLNLKENQTIYQRPPLNLYVFHKFASNVFLAKACEKLVIRQPDNLLVGIFPNPHQSSLRDGCAFLRNTKKEWPGQQCNDCCPGRSVICGQCVCSSLRCTCSSSFCSAP